MNSTELPHSNHKSRAWGQGDNNTMQILRSAIAVCKCVQFDPPCHNDDHGNKPVFSTREHQCFHADAKLFDLVGAKTLWWFLTHIIAAIAFVLSAFHLRRATLALYGHTRQFRTNIGNACVLSHFMCISQVLISAVTADIASMSELKKDRLGWRPNWCNRCEATHTHVYIYYTHTYIYITYVYMRIYKYLYLYLSIYLSIYIYI